MERFYQAVITAYRSIRESGGAADAVAVSPAQWKRLKADVAGHIARRSIDDKPLPTMLAGLVLDVDAEQKEDFMLI